MNHNKIIIFSPLDGISNMPHKKQGNSKEKIDCLIKQLIKGKQSSFDYIKTLNDFKSVNGDSVIYNPRNGSYILDNYYVVPGYIKGDTKFFDNLKFLNRAGFCRTSAPVLLDMTKTQDDDFGVVVFKINDTNGGIVLPYLDVVSDVSLEKKNKFFEEQETLLRSASVYNPAVIENQEAWGVTPDTKNIYIDSWANLIKASSPAQKKSIIDRLKNLLK